MKETWQILKLAINRQNTKSSCTGSFNINGNQVFDKSKIAEEFNTFYANIGISTSLNVPPSRSSFAYYLRNRQKGSLFWEPVVENDVFNVVHKLKSKMSCGHDELPMKIVKLCINNILTPLTHIINLITNNWSSSSRLKNSQGNTNIQNIV